MTLSLLQLVWRSLLVCMELNKIKDSQIVKVQSFRLKKRPQTRLNWTEMDWTNSLVCVYFFPVQFAVLEK